jgi:hypothetical protein
MDALGDPVKGLGGFLGSANRLQPKIALLKIAIPDKLNKF